MAKQKRRFRVPVYSKNAVSLSEDPIRQVSLNEAHSLLSEGKAICVSRRGAPLKIQMKSLERLDQNSPCTLGHAEILANVGLAKRRGESISRGRIETVRAKVACFQQPSWTDCVVWA